MMTRSRSADAAKRSVSSSTNEEELERNNSHEDFRSTTNGVEKNTAGEKNMKTHQASLKGDRGNIAVLTFLYVLQGIPLGLAGAMPMLLQTRKVAYKDQATFSFVFWPFSMKLLWAPIVDTLYFSRFGRRKSWLVPVQYLLGIFMLVLSKVSFLWLDARSCRYLLIKCLVILLMIQPVQKFVSNFACWLFFLKIIKFGMKPEDLLVQSWGWCLAVLKEFVFLYLITEFEIY